MYSLIRVWIGLKLARMLIQLRVVPGLDRLEAGEDADPAQGRGQDDQRQRQPIDAELVLDPEERDPADLLDELEEAAALTR